MFQDQITDFIRLATTCIRRFNLEAKRLRAMVSSDDDAQQERHALRLNPTQTKTRNACGAACHAGKQLCQRLSKAGEDVKPLLHWLNGCKMDPRDGFGYLELHLQEISLRPDAKCTGDGQPSHDDGTSADREASSQSVAADDGRIATKSGQRPAKLKWLTSAMILVNEHPDFSDKKIADEVDVNRSTLSRSDVYQAAAKIARSHDKPPRGSKDAETGQMVARDDD